MTDDYMLSKAIAERSIIDCTSGTPVARKVLGTLPVTVEGDVIGDNCVVWRADANYITMNREPFYELHVGDTRTKKPSYSTRESALAARSAT